MATYYVRQSGGNDSNDGLSFANGWATVQKAADTATGGDLVLICDDGTHSPSVTVDFDTNAGSADAPITFRGAGSAGADDGTVATIDGGSLGASDDLIDKGVNSSYLVFEQLVFSNATQYNFFSDTTGVTIFRRCRFSSASSDGFRTQSTTVAHIYFYDCEFDGNGADGYSINSSARGHSQFYRCAFHDNTSDGARVSGYNANLFGAPNFHGCLFYDNGADGLTIDNYDGFHFIDHCTFFGNTSDGVSIGGSTVQMTFITNSIFRSNGGYGINANSIDVDRLFCRNICSHNNTSGHIDINSGTIPGTGHVLEDPQFASETDGSEDFTPGNSNLNVTISLPVGIG